MAIDRMPDWPLLYIIRIGICYFTQNKLQATCDCDTLFKLLPGEGLPFLVLSIFEHSLNNDTKALVSCSQAIQIEQTKNTRSVVLGASYELRGSVLYDKSHDNEAIQDLDKAIQILPSNFDLYYNRGCRFLSMGSLKEAILILPMQFK